MNKKVFGLIVLVLFLYAGITYSQNDSMVYREQDLKRIGMNYYNFSKQDKFNFEIVVIGGIKNPGIYLIPEGTSLVEVVALTGGAIDESIYDNFKLIRAKNKNPELRSDEVITFSYKEFFEKEYTGAINKSNPLLKAGDIISFPIKPDKDFWDTAQKIATVVVLPLVSLATLVVTLISLNK